MKRENKFHPKESSTNERLGHFRSLADAYCGALKDEGVRCRPYDEATTPLFSRASGAVQANALLFLENALKNISEIKAEGKDIRDNRTLVWRAINALKYIPDSQIFEKIEKDDVIEICGLPDHFHLAWNLRLMESVSLTVEQLLCLPWWELWSRPKEVVAGLLELAERLGRGELSATFAPNVPIHKIQEIHSADLLEIEISIKYVSPLRQDGRNVGYIVVSTNRMPA